jgi:hypothetical protein
MRLKIRLAQTILAFRGEGTIDIDGVEGPFGVTTGRTLIPWGNILSVEHLSADAETAGDASGGQAPAAKRRSAT